MGDLARAAEGVATLLKEREETIFVAESSSGGLISAALLAVPGASAYFRGGGVLYTWDARSVLLGFARESLGEIAPNTGEFALVLARAARERLGTTWGMGEAGAAGPSGDRYGSPPGRSSIAVAGPVERAIVLETGRADREANMRAFAEAALKLLEEVLRGA